MRKVTPQGRMRIGMIAGTIIFAIGAFALLAEEVNPWMKGDRFDAVRYEDQHGSIHVLDGNVSNVVFLADMDAKDSLHEALQDRGQKYLDQHHAVIIADIHRMPYLVSVMFALPAMRDYSYRLYLIREKGPGLRFPQKPGHMTLIRLKDRVIDSIDLFQSGTSLLEALEK